MKGFYMLEIGDKAVDFCLPNQDGAEVCLRDFTGSWVVLYFYPKDNTKGCTTEALDFTVLKDDFAKEGAVILGVSPDSIKKHQNFIAKKELDITLLSDEDKEVIKEYGVWQKKKMYGKEYMGVVRSTFLIDPDGKVAYIWRNVRVKNHAQNVLEKLKELKG
jgi:peroxiredoxin Q/BCP